MMLASNGKNSVGTLYLVATPIGNLEDCSPRVIRTLKEADLIAAEDTRHSRRLLMHFDIHTRMVSYHDHNERERSNTLVADLLAGKSIALVSDAGTPCIADPGYRLVRACRQEGIGVIPIPGPSAAVAALSVSGLPTDRFYFAGFLPAKEGKRQEMLERLARMEDTVLFYESPHRICDTLEAIQQYFGRERELFVGRELTKLHEEHLFGTVGEVLEVFRSREKIKGELVVVVAGSEESLDQADLPNEIKRGLAAREYKPKELAKMLAKRFGVPVADVYAKILQLKEEME